MAQLENNDEPGKSKTPEATPGLPEEKSGSTLAELKSETPDPETDKAVDDIMKKDGDEVLEAQDQVAEEATIMQPTKWEKFKNWNAAWWADPKKRWITIAAVVVVVAAVFAVPFTRYNVLGLVLKSSVTVQAVDSKTGAPVSGATVELSGQKAETQANGKAVMHVNMGSGSLKVSKKYYTGYSGGALVASGKNSFKTTLVATGRQVKIKLVNKVTAKPIGGATVTAGGAKAKTDKKGMATLVIASDVTTQAAEVSLGGYNTTKVTITAGDDLAKNTFSVIPAGKLYFLSNLSGTIDVVKTNLDGTDRQTVLTGTGSEDRYSTSLLASRDWKYLALLSKRSGQNASIYLIDTTNNDKLTTIDEGNADFSLVGWSGSRFVYEVNRNTVPEWQNGKEALKSFDPATGRTLLLDQTQATGTNTNDFVKQFFSQEYLVGDQIIYTKGWTSSAYVPSVMQAKQAELDGINGDGSGHKIIKTFALDPGTTLSYVSTSTILSKPDELYISFQSSVSNTGYYEYEDDKVTADTTMTSNEFNNLTYPTYLLSPSASKTFWADSRDGKNLLFTGNEDAETPKQISNLSDYSAYGWYTDDYVLVSKNSSELYIMGKDGGTPLKITDYYKPAINYQGYGGGYGGL
jgi:hypothetical protein